MSDPWWYSGPPGDPAADGPAPEPDPEPHAGPGPGPGSEQGSGPRSEPESEMIDWTGLLTGAARMVDWARGAVLDPHAEHRDPADHPDCVICRTFVIVGEQSGMSPRGEGASTAAAGNAGPDAAEADEPEPIRWIPLRQG